MGFNLQHSKSKEITYKDLQDTAAGYTYDHKDSKYDLICDPVFNDVILKYNDLIEDRDSFLNLTDFCEKLAWEFCQSKSIQIQSSCPFLICEW